MGNAERRRGKSRGREGQKDKTIGSREKEREATFFIMFGS